MSVLSLILQVQNIINKTATPLLNFHNKSFMQKSYERSRQLNFEITIIFTAFLSKYPKDFSRSQNLNTVVKSNGAFIKKKKGKESKLRVGLQELLSSHREVFCKKGVLRNFAKFTRKHRCQSLFFNKVAGLRPTNIYLSKVSNRNTIKRCKILRLKLTIKTPERRQTSFWCFNC